MEPVNGNYFIEYGKESQKIVCYSLLDAIHSRSLITSFIHEFWCGPFWGYAVYEDMDVWDKDDQSNHTKIHFELRR